MKNEDFTNNPQHVIIAYAEPSYSGIAISYVFTEQKEKNPRLLSKYVLVENGEPLYKAACKIMVGDEAEVNKNGMIIKIHSLSLWKRLKNCCFLFKNRRNHKKNTL